MKQTVSYEVNPKTLKSPVKLDQIRHVNLKPGHSALVLVEAVTAKTNGMVRVQGRLLAYGA